MIQGTKSRNVYWWTGKLEKFWERAHSV